MAKDNKREKILNALENLLPGRRFHEITLDEVAKNAQVGKGTIYLYFKDKDALFSEMICFRLERLKEELEQLHDEGAEKLPEKIFELINGFIRRHHDGFGQIGEFASQIARMAPEELERLKTTAQSIVDTASLLMQRCNPQWSEEQTHTYAQILLWLIDCYSRSDLQGMKNLPSTEILLEFFRRGSGLM